MNPLINQDAAPENRAPTPYRVAFIFCKALALSLWVSALFGLAGFVMTFVLRFLGVSSLGFGFFGDIRWLIQGLAALLIGAIAPALSASMAGQSLLEGESIAARRALMPTEKALMRAAAGLIVLTFGAVESISYLPLLYSQVLSSGANGFLWYAGAGLGVAALKVAVGFLLAFWPALRRSFKSG